MGRSVPKSIIDSLEKKRKYRADVEIKKQAFLAFVSKMEGEYTELLSEKRPNLAKIEKIELIMLRDNLIWDPLSRRFVKIKGVDGFRYRSIYS